MFRRLKKLGRKAVVAACAAGVLALVCIGFTGCRSVKEDGKKVKDLDFTVVGENEIPKELSDLIIQKREKPFKLTYADGEDMYIVIGEGQQKGGGYSIAVKELYLTDNSIVIRTELIGPDKSEAAGADPSFPVLVVKTQFLDEPVVFQ